MYMDMQRNNLRLSFSRDDLLLLLIGCSSLDTSVRMRWLVTGLQTLWKLFVFSSFIPGLKSCCFSTPNWGGVPGLLVLGRPWFQMCVSSLSRSGNNSGRFPDTHLLWKSVITPKPPYTQTYALPNARLASLHFLFLFILDLKILIV